MAALLFVCTRCSGLLLFACLLTAATAEAGVVNLVSQTRFVDVNTQGVPGLVVPPADKRQDAPDFGPFDGSVTLSFPPGTEDTVSQHSTLTLTPDGTGAVFDAHGLLRNTSSQNSLNGTTHFQVDFDLTAPEPYVLTYNGREGDPRFPSIDTFVPGSFTGPSAPGSLAGDPHTTNVFSVLTYNGTLQPGSYELLADVHAIGQGSFDLNLAVGTAAVPLPPALWAVSAMLPVLVWGIKRSPVALGGGSKPRGKPLAVSGRKALLFMYLRAG